MTIELATLFGLAVVVVALFFLAKDLRASIQEVKEVNATKMHLLNRLERTVDRMEKATLIVAEKRAGIAYDLAESVSRADATEGEPGEAADAALRTGDNAHDITARQDAARDDH